MASLSAIPCGAAAIRYHYLQKIEQGLLYVEATRWD